MDGIQLRDEAVRDRIRLAEEFLDPSMSPARSKHLQRLILWPDDPRAQSYRADIILMLQQKKRRLVVSGLYKRG